ncbi:hypothetical protein ACVC7V_17295 [Hydrogenophaga sp. A37]|uniref:hypothetical protein n=1 Tax=Hydrogenophaga sp. A37 TaxID=1945864 RepID=UPI0009844F56|nr:hypothetical protein [Hydrogenophaga sp. A37]OOG79208.1 hypothetical protein B0E41_25640 [Hydrogenophaga sp. A37]
MSEAVETHPAGTVRYYREDGECVITSPRNPLYSTALMCATDFWSEAQGKWVGVLGSDAEAVSDGT